ncbi:MAG: hypothetical protein NTV15_08830 [Candidatus Bathyarchaeota archaeon]|nr:hypothetical protein [Candidatus Bathyarchaeota archaeon]
MLISLSFAGIAGAADRVTINETQLITNYNVTPATVTPLSALQHKILAKKDNRLFVAVYNNNSTQNAGLNVTVQSGTYFGSGLGDLEATIPSLATWLFGPFESSRFQNATGYITIDTNSTNGTIVAYRLPSS